MKFTEKEKKEYLTKICISYSFINLFIMFRDNILYDSEKLCLQDTSRLLEDLKELFERL